MRSGLPIPVQESQTLWLQRLMRYAAMPASSELVPRLSVKVVELVLDHIAYGWSPEELHLQHPYLTLLSDSGTDTLCSGVLLGSPS
jgi:hypothetical protein